MEVDLLADSTAGFYNPCGQCDTMKKIHVFVHTKIDEKHHEIVVYCDDLGCAQYYRIVGGGEECQMIWPRNGVQLSLDTWLHASFQEYHYLESPLAISGDVT